jgi:hypothetical protein
MLKIIKTFILLIKNIIDIKIVHHIIFIFTLYYIENIISIILYIYSFKEQSFDILVKTNIKHNISIIEAEVPIEIIKNNSYFYAIFAGIVIVATIII